MSTDEDADLHLVSLIGSHQRGERIARLETACQRRVETGLLVEVGVRTSDIRTIDVREIARVARGLLVVRRILYAQSDRLIAVVNRHRAGVSSRNCFGTRKRHATGTLLSLLDVNR